MKNIRKSLRSESKKIRVNICIYFLWKIFFILIFLRFNLEHTYLFNYLVYLHYICISSIINQNQIVCVWRRSKILFLGAVIYRYIPTYFGIMVVYYYDMLSPSEFVWKSSDSIYLIYYLKDILYVCIPSAHSSKMYGQLIEWLM